MGREVRKCCRQKCGVTGVESERRHGRGRDGGEGAEMGGGRRE